MIRSLFVAFLSLVVVSTGLTAMQPGAKPGAKPIPVSVTGGTPGVNIEVFLNSPKMADAVVDATGGANWLLDISNLGKTRVDIYVDVCQDGKVVKVKFVSGNGQAPPKDEGCDRKLAAASFQSDCGVISINLDFRNFGAKVIGCGMKFTDPKILTTIGGVVLGGVLVGVSGGGGTTATTSTGVTSPPAATVPPVVAVPPPATTPPPPTVTNPTPPTNTTPSAPIEFSVTITGMGWDHVSPGQFSDGCGRGITTPAQVGAQVIVTATGQGVSQPSVSTTTDNTGAFRWRNRITSFGPIAFRIRVTSQGVEREVTGGTTVTGASNVCP